jgi:fatty-acyl-CoA synthase
LRSSTVAVYGVADERNAEDQAMACLELRAGATFDPEDFTTFLDGQADLGTKWAPRYVRITDDLPVTGTSKIDKKPLRAEEWRTSDPVWWRPDRRERTYRPLTPTEVADLDRALDERRRRTPTGSTEEP